MSSFYSILIDLGVLCFFGLLFYWYQKRRIIRNSTYEIQVGLQKLIYDLHNYLDQKESEEYYQELNTYTEKLEQLIQSPSLIYEKDQLNPPNSFPIELKDDLYKIQELF